MEDARPRPAVPQQVETKLQIGALGFPHALATAVGLIIASSVLLTVTQGFGVGGSVFALAIMIAFILMLCQSASFAEAAGMLPTSGAVYDYIAAGLGRFWAITGTLAAYIIVHVFAGTAEVSAIGLFAQVNFDVFAALPAEQSWIIGVVLVLIFAVVNYLGVDLFGRIELVMTAVMWLTLVIFGLIGLLMAPQSGISGFFGESAIGNDLTAVLSMTGLAMFLFVGVEFVTPLAPELRNPNRTLPRAMYLGLLLVAVAMFVYGAAITRLVANEELPDGSFLFDTPLPIPLFADAVLGGFGKFWLGLAVLLAGASTVNTLLAAIPRILYGMAKDGSLPQVFAYLHPRYKTPVVGIVVSALIPIVGAIFIQGNIGAIIAFILAAVCAWLFSYILVNISVVVLRMRRPDLHRPYKTPLYPLPQVLGSLGMLLTIWFITPPFLTRDQIYVPFLVMLVICAVFALVWSYARGLQPWAPVDPELLKREEGLVAEG
jgi:amino acid transporter